jgi:uncharacterized membrane protein (UPF0127 family)
MVNDIKFRLKDKIFFFLAITGLILAFYLSIFDSNTKDNNGDWQSFSEMYKNLSDRDKLDLKIQDNIFHVEVARSENSRHQGLGNRDFLPDNSGMLFVFSQKGRYVFVMRDMKIDLDFIFIKNGEVFEVIKNIPSDFKGILRGESDYDDVLEIRAGWSDQYGITIGDKVFINKSVD